MVSDVPVQFYTGSALTPSFTVKGGEVILKEGTDYVVDFQNNIQVGTANVLIRGKRTYSFSITKTFSISYNIATVTADLIADQLYTGSAATPEVLV